MPAPAPTFGNAAGEDLDMPEVGTTAGLSVTMFLNETFHTRVAVAGHLFILLRVLTCFESISLFFSKCAVTF